MTPAGDDGVLRTAIVSRKSATRVRFPFLAGIPARADEQKKGLPAKQGGPEQAAAWNR
jgi:hypothetical protein